MKNIVAVILCLFIIAGCTSRKKQARYFDYKSFGGSYAKLNDSLFACITEVSNKEYKDFLNHLWVIDTAKYKLYNMDSTKWWKLRSLNIPDKGRISEKYYHYYKLHSAFNNHPAVNISHEGATAYCQWLTNNYNKKTKRKFNKVKFRLPSIEEWVFAAKGGNKDARFPWKGRFIRNTKGEYLANFNRINEGAVIDSIINGQKFYLAERDELNYYGKPFSVATLSSFFYTPVKSYYPNNYGLYNMAGNVSEMVAKKGYTKGGNWNSYSYFLWIDAQDEFDGQMLEPSPLVGFRVFIEVLEE